MSDAPYFSVVVPMYNEKGNAGPLYEELRAEMKKLGKPFEVIIVDDASTDGTADELADKSPLIYIRMRKNAGQSSALDAGIKHAKGKILITMDGDGQDDPSYIPALLEEMHRGYDVVCAWRHKRQDSFGKRLVSGGWKYLRSYLVDDVVHDAGTQFRVYDRSVFDDLELYGELHRFIPALLNWRGYKIGEVKVNHRPRIHGITKYSWTKIFKGFSDMLYMWFWHKYDTRPVHLFGTVGIISMGTGMLILLFMGYLRLFQGYQLSNKIWPLVGFFFVMIGIQMFATGVLAASLVRIDTSRKYYIAEVIER
jgi:glycosyltransferase involved in cell wall biosynthesis